MTSSAQKKKIAYISGTRADFGLMTPVLNEIKKSELLDLKLYFTGEHLMAEFGSTMNHVKRYFPNAVPIRAVFEKDGRIGMAKFTSKLLDKVIDIFDRNKPDLVLVLGDRPEMLSVATACLYLGIPIGHIHGGEKTGTVDEIARHAITKMSHIHFSATKEATLRIEKMGEDDWRINKVGAPGIDVILNEKLPNKDELFRRLNLNPEDRIILVTQHPVSEDISNAGRQMEITMSAVKEFNMPVVVIYPHADAGGKKIIEVIKKEQKNPMFRIFPSLEYKIFLALERETSVWVGNSSGAIIESASFGTPVVNIGNRQHGRLRSGNIIDVGYNKKEIIDAINKSLNDEKYRIRIKAIKNCWGDGKASSRIVSILEKLEITPQLLNKQISY